MRRQCGTLCIEARPTVCVVPLRCLLGIGWQYRSGVADRAACHFADGLGPDRPGGDVGSFSRKPWSVDREDGCLSRPNQGFGGAPMLVFVGRPRANTASMQPIEVTRPQAQAARDEPRRQEWIALRSIRAGTAAQESVRDAQTLMHAVGFGNALGVLRVKLAFPDEVFALAARPLVQGHAEFVQMLPVTGSKRFCAPGGQLRRALTRTLHVLDRRRAKVLPPGGAPEAIGAQAHRWTYAAMVAALLQDMGRLVVGLRVELVRADGTLEPWETAAGSMAECGAVAYSVDSDVGEVETAVLSPPIALQLFERCVPTCIREWVQQDTLVWSELFACLQGATGAGGSLADLLVNGQEFQANASARQARGTVLSASVASRSQMAETGEGDPSAAPSANSSTTPSRDSDGCAFLDDVVPGGSALARQFIAWLDQGLENGSLVSNQADAMVFRVPEGLLLVSPKVFRAYVQQGAHQAEQLADTARRLQREVLRAGWHRCTVTGGNFHGYAFASVGGQVRQIQGVLLPQPRRLVRNLPPVDTRLRLCDLGADGA
jgi:hypothetical protein